MRPEMGLLDRDLPEPYYVVLSVSGVASLRRWKSRVDLQEWVRHYRHEFASPPVAIIRVIPKPRCQ